LLVHSKIRTENDHLGKIIFFIGAMALSLMLSIHFTQKHKE